MQIIKISPDGKLLATFGGPGTAPGKFSWPILVRVGNDGDIYVAESTPAIIGSSGDTRIQELSPDGKSLAVWPVSGAIGGLALDGAGNIYYSDPTAQMIVKLSPEGGPLARWYGAGDVSFRGPMGLAVDGQGDIFVADRGDIDHQRIVELSPSGTLLGEWGRPGAVTCGNTSCTRTQNPEFQVLNSIAVDSAGNMYVVDGGESQVVKLSPGGQELARWGTTGRKPGQFYWANDIALDGNGDLYVTEPTPLNGSVANNRVQELSPSGQVLRIWR